MHPRLGTRRRQAGLIALGLIAAASAGTLRTPSVAEAHASGTGESSRMSPVVSEANGASLHVFSASQAPDGKQIYATTCAACHQQNGEGVEGPFPPLVGSEWVTGDSATLVRIILHGVTGPLEVAGETYAGAMPPWGGVLKDADVAAVATYIRGAWGNKAGPVSAATVAKLRAAHSTRKLPWTSAELVAAAKKK